jgi:uncharacterized phage infection (PIP) family protein YhgE
MEIRVLRNILRIFRNDLKAIYKYFFVILIVIALGTLPSLYAWINIYGSVKNVGVDDTPRISEPLYFN